MSVRHRAPEERPSQAIEAGASYRVIEHEPEGRTEVIAKIRGNRIEQSIKSIVVQVRLNRKENIYCLANVPGDCRIDFEGIRVYYQADTVAFASREKAQALTGCVIGAIPPFSFSDGLQVLADPLGVGCDRLHRAHVRAVRIPRALGPAAVDPGKLSAG